MGEPRHRHRLLSLVAVARGQGNPEQRRGSFGVFAEQLIEITHAKEQQGVRIAGLELAILLHHGCLGRVGHGAYRRQGEIGGECDRSARHPPYPGRIWPPAAESSDLKKLTVRDHEGADRQVDTGWIAREKRRESQSRPRSELVECACSSE